MLIEIEIVEVVDRMGRKYYHDLFHLKCDGCGKFFSKREKRVKILSRKSHNCSIACKKIVNQRGGAIDVQRRQTMLEKYGTVASMEVPEFLDKYKSTMLSTHGVEFPMQLESVKDILQERMVEVHGVRHGLQSQEILTKAQDALEDLYGVRHGFQSPVIKERCEDACEEKFGVRNVMHLEEYLTGHLAPWKHCEKGHFDFRGKSIQFRSSYERIFLENCSHNHEIVEIVPNIKVWYKNSAGKKSVYWADFGLVFSSGKRILVEIKPASQVLWPVNLAKFDVARSQLEDLGYDEFVVLTEFDLGTYRP